MAVIFNQDKSSGTWELAVLEAIHNHVRSTDFSTHPAHRIAAIAAETGVEIDTLAKVGLSNAQICFCMLSYIDCSLHALEFSFTLLSSFCFDFKIFYSLMIIATCVVIY